ncbi:MAG: transketolase [Bacteroidetes Order II. Incertae sedis bacterium]|nr:transketolase [Bacteroidetes Order II. bacterium]
MQDLAHLRRRCADTIRFLSADAVQKANSGHPGMPMGMADAAAVLWTERMRHNPADPTWFNRDRFVLSAGHGSMLLYSLLHLTGYDLSMDQIRNFRQWGSKTAGHPEYRHTPGVEMTTGPLGQGISTAVGMAIAERHLAARYNTMTHPIINHYTYVIASDGDLMEGVSHEACAIAGHLGLGKLIVLYDDNGISIDGPTSLSFTEDVLKRYEAYGWQTIEVDGHNPEEVLAAIDKAKADSDRPTIIACKTQIGFGSPNKQGKSSAHGSPLGTDELKLAKETLGWPIGPEFYVPDDVFDYMLSVRINGRKLQSEWDDLMADYRAEHPEKSLELDRAIAGILPTDWEDALPHFALGTKMATREASGHALNALKTAIPNLLGGSADLTPSNNTRAKADVSMSHDDFSGRYLHFGVREHGMGAIVNGITLHGGLVAYTGTFLAFLDYMRPAVRLAALMEIPSLFVFTHDSIGLGEDGPTHQPVEHLASIRAMPNVVNFRPADANETVAAWKYAVQSRVPVTFALSRQGLPVVSSGEGVARGAYILSDAPAPQALLLSTGSEVQIALAAQKLLLDQGISSRVVSMPSWELFEAQDDTYKASVLPPSVTVRVAVEAANQFGWERYLGTNGAFVGMKGFGASAPIDDLYRNFDITASAVALAAKTQLGLS